MIECIAGPTEVGPAPEFGRAGSFGLVPEVTPLSTAIVRAKYCESGFHA